MVSLCLVVTGVALLGSLLGGRAEKGKLHRILRLQSLHLKWIAWTAGLQIEAEGELAWPDHPFLLLSNHVSYWDIIAISSLRPMAFVAKSEIASWPLVGFLVSQCQTLYVERNTGVGRFRALIDLKKRLAHCPVCIFPEGTTSARSHPVWSQWYRGQVSVLKRPGIPVYTLALHYQDQEECAWVDDDALVPHLWRCLLRDSMKLRVSLQKLEASLPPRVGLAPYARLAFEQTATLCQSLSQTTGVDTRLDAITVANFSVISGLTEK